MRSLRAIVALARADLFERARRSSFLVTLGLVLWLGMGTFDGTVSVNIDETQGTTNAAWVGGMMTLVAITFLSLVGFWVVKNAVHRDERTGVGPILATTPLRRVEYTLGKALSHLLVLGSMVALLALCGIVLLAVQGRGGAGATDGWAFLAPFVFCAVPAFALTAALAILFETTPGLRGGAANALWLGLWGALLSLSMGARSPLLDPWGILILQRSMAAAAEAQLGANPAHFSIELNPGMAQAPASTFVWTGVHWTPEIVFSRLAWLAVAAGIAALAAVPFHRFDPSRRRRPAVAPARRAAPSAPRRTSRFALGAFLPPGIVGAELRLLLAGANRWWILVAAGLVVAGWVAPLPAARSGVLLAAWIWPLLRWSDLGARDARHGTEALLLSAPGAVARQVPAAWIAGALLTAIIGSGVGVRLAASGDGNGFASWLAAVLFIPALALALGLVSRGNRLFEVTYVVLWYVGPVSRTPPLDFLGATPGSRWSTWFVAAGLALAVAFAARARQARG